MLQCYDLCVSMWLSWLRSNGMDGQSLSRCLETSKITPVPSTHLGSTASCSWAAEKFIYALRQDQRFNIDSDRIHFSIVSSDKDSQIYIIRLAVSVPNVLCCSVYKRWSIEPSTHHSEVSTALMPEIGKLRQEGLSHLPSIQIVSMGATVCPCDSKIYPQNKITIISNFFKIYITT